MCVIPSDMLPKLIVFARAPVRGKVKTRLACELSPDFALDLHTAMTADLLSRLEQIRASMDVELHADEITEAWDLHVIARRVQVPGDLGRRMRQAITDGLEAGHPAVIIIGSDSPTLPLTHLSALLETHTDVVLGPTPDGGFYAILCRRAHANMFGGVTWSAPTTAAETIEAIRKCGLTVALGPEWYDIDTSPDLQRLASDPNLGSATRRVLEAAVRL